MKLLVALCLVAVVAAAPPVYNPQGVIDRQVDILRYENDIGSRGFNYAWEQTDGQKAQQAGQLRNEGREDEFLAVTGSFSYIGPDGVTYTVNYTADENGYQPVIEQGPGGGVPPSVVASLLG